MLNCRGHPSFGMGCFLQLQPLPSWVGLASSQRPLEDTGIGSGDFGQARGGEGVLVLFLYPKQPESLITQKWPLSGYCRVGMKGRGAQVLGCGGEE